MMRRLVRGGALALLLLTLLGGGLPPAAVEAQQPGQPRQGGSMIAAITGDPTILNPAATSNLPALGVSANIYNTLLRMDNDLKVQPELAERWEVGSDGKTYTVFLRRNVKWHDGQPFTSADVK